MTKGKEASMEGSDSESGDRHGTAASVSAAGPFGDEGPLGMKMLQGEVNTGPASRQAEAGRAPAHEE